MMPVEWLEVPDGGPTGAIRHVSYTLTIAVRADGAFEGYRRLDRLSAVAQAALIGSDLGGVCFAGLTRLDAGRYDRVEDVREEAKWDALIESKKGGLVAAARKARKEIAAGKATDMDFDKL